MPSNNSDVADVQDRLVALCALIDLSDLSLDSITATEELGDCTISSLPTFEVARGRMINSNYESANQFVINREYYLRLYTAAICGDDAIDNASRAIAAACALPVFRFFANRRTLWLTTGTDGVCHASQIVQDTGDVRMSQGGQLYAGIMFRMQVVTRHRI